MDDRLDLAALVSLLTRSLVERERPILDAHGLSMWGYVILSRLARGDAPTQLALAADIGHDKTRLIADLDALERDGLLTRRPDPADRRARLVSMTAAGRRRHTAAQRDIRAMEDQVLADLSARERAQLLTTLGRLTLSA